MDFHNNIITRNSRLNGEWGEKEDTGNLYDRKDDTLNPIVSGKMNSTCVNALIWSKNQFAGEIFKFYILIGDQQFHIAINNQPYCKFNYRQPAETIRTVELMHDLQFLTQIDHRSVFPSPHPPVQFDDARNIFSNDVPKPFRHGEFTRATETIRIDIN